MTWLVVFAGIAGMVGFVLVIDYVIDLLVEPPKPKWTEDQLPDRRDH